MGVVGGLPKWAALTAVLILGACSRASNLVAAPMLSVDASAAAIALVTDPRPTVRGDAGKDLLIHSGDRFVGTYECPQGETEVRILLGDIVRGEGDLVTVDGSFDFNFDGKGGNRAASGSATLTGTFEPRTRRLQLHGGRWIDQPSGYRIIGFLGSVTRNGQTFQGRVEGDGCESFTTTLEQHEEGGD